MQHFQDRLKQQAALGGFVDLLAGQVGLGQQHLTPGLVDIPAGGTDMGQVACNFDHRAVDTGIHKDRLGCIVQIELGSSVGLLDGLVVCQDALAEHLAALAEHLAALAEHLAALD